MWKILISPYSSKVKNPADSNAKNAKNFPYFDRLILLLTDNGHEVNQIGVKDEVKFKKTKEFYQDKSIPEIIALVNEHDIWVSIDNMLPHLCYYYKLKPGIVIWGKSDPLLFGYPENINILKDRKCLRDAQFFWWHTEPFVADVFPTAQRIFDTIQKEFHKSYTK